MKQLCPVCGKPISKNWLLLGSPSTPYQCPKCKSRLEFTGKRYLVSFLTGLIGALPILIAFYYQIRSWSLFLIFYLVILILDLFIVLRMPGQFSLSSKETGQNLAGAE